MDMKQQALTRALALLKIAGLRYAIETSEGEIVATEGDTLAASVVPQRVRTVKTGEYLEVYKPLMDAMNPGDVTVIPSKPEWKLEFLQGAISSYAHRKWGSESHMTELNRDTGAVTVARIV